MASEAFAIKRCGLLTVCVKAVDGCPELAAVLATLPEAMPVMWLDSARIHEATGRYSLLGYDPWLSVIAREDRIEQACGASRRVVRANPLEALRSVLRRYAVPSGALGAAGRGVGLLGWVSYELNRWIEPRLQRAAAPSSGTEPSLPVMAWFGMRVVIVVDHLARRSWVVSVADPSQPSAQAQRDARQALEEALERLAGCGTSPPIAPIPDPPLPTQPWRRTAPLAPTISQAAFEAMVERALEHVRAGEIFQANVSQRFTGPWEGSARALYLALRRVNPSPFSVFCSVADVAVVGCSPERLVKVEEGRVTARPIAGTRPRGSRPEEDACNSLELLLSEKERAEHLMLVDLARNDLGRVCDVGTVRVAELMGLETYSHVIHLVSEISGRLRREVDAVDVIRAVFPGGTITGCPKVRCMELLQALEPAPRGLYTGSLGYLAFDGTMDLNIAIRTLVLRGEQMSLHVGAGIVADSDPAREYQETLDKAAALFQALTAASSTSTYAEPR